MHIAAALKKPLISIWGNTVPEFGMYPYYSAASIRKEMPYDIFEIRGLNCRPCSKIGFNRCPERHFKCMEMISPEEIAIRTRERMHRP
jgi:ADP-heptose:LPS heptosyltransferase